jgi:GT2 family glycosyltransferase
VLITITVIGGRRLMIEWQAGACRHMGKESAMPDKTARRRSRAAMYRQTLHELNQRYREAWDRAERLQDELADIKNSRMYGWLCWWRNLASLWRGSPRRPRQSFLPFTSENLDGQLAPPTGTVSILVPFKDHVDLLCTCLRGLRRGHDRPSEILLLDNGSTCRHTLEFLQRGQALGRFKVVACPEPFNFAGICNRGARQATGDFLLFLNNDVEVLDPDWLAQLLRLGNCPDIGAVGATLLYPDRTLQHAGIFPTSDGHWSHVYRGQPASHPGNDGELRFARTVPAVTGACFLIRRDLFIDMSGFDERYPLTHNDVDLCLRLRERGLKIAVSPHARLWHFESLSRGFSKSPTLP